MNVNNKPNDNKNQVDPTLNLPDELLKIVISNLATDGCPSVLLVNKKWKNNCLEVLTQPKEKVQELESLITTIASGLRPFWAAIGAPCENDKIIEKLKRLKEPLECLSGHSLIGISSRAKIYKKIAQILSELPILDIVGGTKEDKSVSLGFAWDTMPKLYQLALVFHVAKNKNVNDFFSLAEPLGYLNITENRLIKIQMIHSTLVEMASESADFVPDLLDWWELVDQYVLKEEKKLDLDHYKSNRRQLLCLFAKQLIQTGQHDHLEKVKTLILKFPDQGVAETYLDAISTHVKKENDNSTLETIKQFERFFEKVQIFQ